MPEVTVSTFAAATHALKQRDLRQALYDEGAVVMDRVLVNLHGDEHKARRNVESKVFRRNFFRYYETEVFPATLQETLAPFLDAGHMDLVDFGYRVMVNLTVDFTGIDRPNKSAQETEALVAMLRLFGRTATLAHYKDDREQIRREAVAALDEFDRRFVTPSAERRRALIAKVDAGEADEGTLPRDILTVLLRSEHEIDLPKDVLVREMAFFALAGAHTSIHTLGHAMHEMFSWAAAHPEDWPRFETDTAFLQRAVHESIRLHPSSPVAVRRALCPMRLQEDAVEEGDQVVIDLQSANRDTAAFGGNAARFDPHREIPSGLASYGLSFGLGMHACLGLNLAAGVLPKSGAHEIEPQTQERHLGTITLIAKALLDHGARPDPKDPPRKDDSTARDLWAVYPVRFGVAG